MTHGCRRIVGHNRDKFYFSSFWTSPWNLFSGWSEIYRSWYRYNNIFPWISNDPWNFSRNQFLFLFHSFTNPISNFSIRLIKFTKSRFLSINTMELKLESGSNLVFEIMDDARIFWSWQNLHLLEIDDGDSFPMEDCNFAKFDENFIFEILHDTPDFWFYSISNTCGYWILLMGKLIFKVPKWCLGVFSWPMKVKG